MPALHSLQLKLEWLRKKTVEKHFLGLLPTQIYKGPAADYRCFRVCTKNRDDNSQGGKCLTNLGAYCYYDDLQQLCNNWINLIAVSGLHMAEDSPQGWQGCSFTAFPPLTPWRPCRKWVAPASEENLTCTACRGEMLK